MTERIFNFSAGPAVLPVPVLEEAQRDLLSLPGVGMSVTEISHRSKTFDEIFTRAESGVRELLSIPENYHILFLQGGASLQFSMVPMNFLPAERSADYILTGSWGKKAVKEAKRVANVNVAGTMADGAFTRVPNQDELNLDPNAAYVHITSNETIEGVQWKHEPETGDVPLISDASSDILSRAIPVEKYALIYDAIDATDFYRGHADADSRSPMNVTFRLPSEELDKKFTSEATAQGLDGLKGHRSVGGIRASIYNAFPKAGVEALVSFMKDFERRNG